MANNSRSTSMDFISFFTFEELLQEVEFDLRIKEFVVMEIETANHTVELNKPFRSDYFVVFMIQKGNIGFKIEDKSYEAEKGDIIFSPIAETVCIEKVSDDYKAKYIFFSLDFIWKLASIISRMMFLKVFPQTLPTLSVMNLIYTGE